jgi:apolipoprotein N-acyltransferase
LAYAPSNLRFATQKTLREKGVFLRNFCVFAQGKSERIAVIAWAAALVAALVYGFTSPSDFSSKPHVNIALIQHNTDPWKGGIAEYRNNFNTLRRLSDEALAADPQPDLVVWSETAFVPRIYWHETYRDDPASWVLVKELLDYLAEQDVPFIIGNDDARRDPAINPNAAEGYRIDYNAALLYEKGVNTAIYRKLHLVPFTEHFPYQKQFPGIHRALLEADTHFWEKGSDATVFQGPGFTFSTPICFEDTFGYLSRMFVQNGADIIVNISNDAWSASLPAQNQHLGIAVFRAVENRRSMVRSTSSGQTCGIAPNGKITAMAPPFTESWLTVAVPVVRDEHTVYTRRGDFLAIGFSLAAALLLIFGGASCIMGKITKRRLYENSKKDINS